MLEKYMLEMKMVMAIFNAIAAAAMASRRSRKNVYSVVFSGRHATNSWNRSRGGLKKLHYKRFSCSVLAHLSLLGPGGKIYWCNFFWAAMNGPSPYENVILAPYSSAEWISQASIMEAATENAIKAKAVRSRPRPLFLAAASMIEAWDIHSADE